MKCHTNYLLAFQISVICIWIFTTCGGTESGTNIFIRSKYMLLALPINHINNGIYISNILIMMLEYTNFMRILIGLTCTPKCLLWDYHFIFWKITNIVNNCFSIYHLFMLVDVVLFSAFRFPFGLQQVITEVISD